MNWHWIFHFFTADWITAESDIDWERVGVVHGPYHSNLNVVRWAKYTHVVYRCSWCGKTHTRRHYNNIFDNTHGDKPEWK